MTALIVIFITLSLMGSALWILPPKKERDRMALRLYARKLGLTVQLTSINLPDKWDKSTNNYKVVAYSYHRLKPLTSLSGDILLLPYEVWKYSTPVAGWWSNSLITLTKDAKDILQKYSDLLIGIRIMSGSVALYWNEVGDDGELKELSKLIYELVEIRGVTA